MPKSSRSARAVLEDLLPAQCGFGPLLQRDYWAVIRGCRLKPSEVMALVAGRFPEFSPDELAAFNRPGEKREDWDPERPLRSGDELEVRIRMAGTFKVRVLHMSPTSLTLGTLEGHPEAGRITFGAYRNDRGDVVFHIRSVARSSNGVFFACFIAMGDAMQTNTWADFVERVALSAGDGVLAYIHADKIEVPDGALSQDESMRPTYVARGD